MIANRNGLGIHRSTRSAIASPSLWTGVRAGALTPSVVVMLGSSRSLDPLPTRAGGGILQHDAAFSQFVPDGVCAREVPAHPSGPPLGDE